MSPKYKLQLEATQLLKKSGYRYDGRIRGCVSRDQSAFEGRLISTPCGGQAKTQRKGK